MKHNVTPPYLGVAYYPEDWDESEMAYDIEMMKNAGINVARIGEFAWSKMGIQYVFRHFGKNQPEVRKQASRYDGGTFRHQGSCVQDGR